MAPGRRPNLCTGARLQVGRLVGSLAPGNGRFLPLPNRPSGRSRPCRHRGRSCWRAARPAGRVGAAGSRWGGRGRGTAAAAARGWRQAGQPKRRQGAVGRASIAIVAMAAVGAVGVTAAVIGAAVLAGSALSVVGQQRSVTRQRGVGRQRGVVIINSDSGTMGVIYADLCEGAAAKRA
jgi:hypothetical protein